MVVSTKYHHTKNHSSENRSLAGVLFASFLLQFFLVPPLRLQTNKYLTSCVLISTRPQPDSSCQGCKFCYKSFTFTRRRHHCRVCGDLFCADCSSGMARLNPATAEPAQDGTYLGRVCANCHYHYSLSDRDWFSAYSTIGSAILSSVEAIEKRWNVR